MLTRDKSAFEAMFSLGSCTRSTDALAELHADPGPVEGQSDERPIHVQGDTAEEFASLLWALYALPHEIKIAMSIPANETHFINLTRMAHKYQFRTTELWALTTLIHFHATASPNSLVSVENLVRITELSTLCDSKELLDAATAQWKKLLIGGKALAAAINVAEQLDLRSLLGLAYYYMMLKGRDYWDADAQLTARQRIRLLSGHYNLVRASEDLPDSPPQINHDLQCMGKGQCKAAFAALWKFILTSNGGEPGLSGQVLPRMQSCDLIGKLMLGESILQTMIEGSIPPVDLSEWGWMHKKCKQNALAAMKDKVKDTQTRLADWFSDVV
ncbi:unnamed protein product [Mycena citricolor]|uniref:BTB domain-containing protein n=1 Tax=Mycena citricolor TaxID=2018698 RepID=A0AAD2K2P6_9AGAR|nr:unnamed protein product [Mycena citricolor]